MKTTHYHGYADIYHEYADIVFVHVFMNSEIPSQGAVKRECNDPNVTYTKHELLSQLHPDQTNVYPINNSG